MPVSAGLELDSGICPETGNEGAFSLSDEGQVGSRVADSAARLPAARFLLAGRPLQWVASVCSVSRSNRCMRFKSNESGTVVPARRLSSGSTLAQISSPAMLK